MSRRRSSSRPRASTNARRATSSASRSGRADFVLKLAVALPEGAPLRAAVPRRVRRARGLRGRRARLHRPTAVLPLRAAVVRFCRSRSSGAADAQEHASDMFALLLHVLRVARRAMDAFIAQSCRASLLRRTRDRPRPDATGQDGCRSGRIGAHKKLRGRNAACGARTTPDGAGARGRTRASPSRR
jgi:hypothetical protein